MKLVRAAMFVASALFVCAFTLTVHGQGQKTWTDEQYDKITKEVGATSGALRKAIEGQNAEMAKTNATKMATLFTDTQAFWKSRNVTEAAETAGEALTHAKAIESAVDAKDFTKAAAEMKSMQGNCASCHKQYRDKGPDGNWRIKP